MTSSTGNEGCRRATSTARSIMGSFLGIDMLDKCDKDDSARNQKTRNG